ncbi:MAG: NosD domain-containing protein [Candidatus Bathyarchaeia archaeon]
MRRVFVVCGIALLTLAFLCFISRVPMVHAWVGTVYIRSDGRIEPVGAPINTTDGIVYKLWDNISVNSFMAKGIVIERDNIILDGNGFTVYGSQSQLTTGVDLGQRNNVTVKNLNVEGHAFGINLYQSVNIKVQACNITGNNWGIDLKYSNSSMISENSLADNGLAIRLGSSSTHNFILRNNVTGAGSGIVIQENCNFTIISENYLNGSFSVTASGIAVSASENKILRNTITAYGASDISLSYATKNLIYGNNITFSGSGVDLHENADNNTIAGNMIAFNGFGIYIYMASYNRIYHNWFYQNGVDIEVDDGVINYFDGGYPMGGNYWLGYSRADVYHGPNQDQEGSDGIIDQPYQTSYGIVDRYPLLAPPAPLPLITIDGLTYIIEIMSNSTVSDLYINPEEGPFIKFNVSGLDGTIGFSRVIIPKEFLWTENCWVITINGQAVTYALELSDTENTYLYFTYTHSTKTVTIQGTNIIPEYPTITSPILLLLITTLITITRSKKQKTSHDIKNRYFYISVS